MKAFSLSVTSFFATSSDDFMTFVVRVEGREEGDCEIVVVNSATRKGTPKAYLNPPRLVPRESRNALPADVISS